MNVKQGEYDKACERLLIFPGKFPCWKNKKESSEKALFWIQKHSLLL